MTEPRMMLPDRETAKRHGWTHQVQWFEDGKPCLVRCRSGLHADAWADRLLAQGHKPVVIDLTDELQLH